MSTNFRKANFKQSRKTPAFVKTSKIPDVSVMRGFKK